MKKKSLIILAPVKGTNIPVRTTITAAPKSSTSVAKPTGSSATVKPPAPTTRR